MSIEVKSMHKYFKFNQETSQTIPVMVSLKTLDKPESADQSKEAAKEDNSDRPNVDLVCVIDNSGSMSGYKIENVKRTLDYLLELLGDDDRLCLIIFNSSA